MRIISKFRDYYDSAQGMGIDDHLTFVRKQEVIEDVELPDRVKQLFDSLPFRPYSNYSIPASRIPIGRDALVQRSARWIAQL